MKKWLLAITMVSVAWLTGCTAVPPAKIASEGVRSILVVPVVNETNSVGADLLMVSRIAQPLSEKGYYVYPTDTVKMVLEAEGLYEPERVQQLEPAKACEMFHSDAVLYIKVKYWDAQYAVFDTITKITVEYALYKADGQQLFKNEFTHARGNGASGGGLVGLVAQAVAAAITRAAPDYRLVSTEANLLILNNWEDGPYKTHP